MVNDQYIYRKQLFLDSNLLDVTSHKKVIELSKKLDKSFLKIALDYGFISRGNYKKQLLKNNIEFYQFDFNTLNNFTYFDACKEDLYYFLNAIAFPLKNNNGDVEVIVSDPSDTNNVYSIADKLGLQIYKVHIAEDLDILKALHVKYGDDILYKAVFNLYDQDPESSAIETFTYKQVVFLGIMGIIALLFLFFYPKTSIVCVNVFINLFLFSSILFKFILTIAGSKVELESKITPEEVTKINDDDLPIYTILLPVFKESEVIYKLALNLKNLDYPKDKLDVKLLIESDDEVTTNAVKDLVFPTIFEPIVIPYAMPKTKPKACNYGLYFSKGKYLTIYDAEDIPDKDQLKQVCVLFDKIPKEYIAIQCALNYFNKTENYLTKMFTLEYSYWFDYMLPGLDKLKIPIPLGGTSNHFKLDKLRELGGWDGFNVTEDADLGLRSYAKNYKITVLNSTTNEEANNDFYNWIRQRSRWIKGYMQTYLVHMRNPIKLYKTVGLKAFLGFNFFIGGTVFTFLSYPVLLLFIILYYVFKSEWIGFFFPEWLIIIAIISFSIGNIIMIYMNMIAIFKRKSYSLILYAITNPIYWIMHSISAYKGLIQLITKPFYWEKTNHGLTKTTKES
ncbi:hypothetical protein FHR24_001115 [Wenyingzhuangia heitensis]|uniref:Glycosyltransferase 2-like domain-containing protein n=1 Tax=Wenyingzhuangia heitensis TaxID=1487859 RepID=A0ABX0UAS6_9FLAO|nr:glycosyltransferase family 2 protein [Wenyingzhuangia heitensis]NIJ44676.1 hypothetical protein [Wenyingzhuangia heitensis]